jgi:Icc-related predicted phosphoesterase
MVSCLFASDLHGRIDRYEKLFGSIESEEPDVVFLGGDLLPHFAWRDDVHDDFLCDFVAVRLEQIKKKMAAAYPEVFVILGNDDARAEEITVKQIAAAGTWTYVHHRRCQLGRFDVYGYAVVPPSPFLRKDWEKYDVSRYTPPGSVSPEEGRRSVPVDPRDARHSTIQDDLDSLAGNADLSSAVFLFHTPPHDTALDRAALDGKMIDHVPLDVHVGSIAVRRFIEARQPLLTLHGHIHESTRLTGAWRDRIGQTHMFNASHDGPELALIKFDLENPHDAERVLL